MRRYWERVDSRWIIPSPKRGCRGPAAVRKLLCRGPKQAQYPKIRFHNLRRTFVITTLEYGIGAKTLSAVVGHRSSSTTLNVYTYVTKVIERQTAAKIDQRIGKQRTPLEEAQASGNMEGWKVNEVTEFTSSEGEDPNNDYTDNVIFPSGKTDPYTISDWEWMFEIFEKAYADLGIDDSYCISMYYPGFSWTGDLCSCFGGGNFAFYEDEFRERLQTLLQEIYNPEEPFTQTEDKRKCEFCDFRELCRR